jgi:hypothetical protein
MNRSFESPGNFGQAGFSTTVGGVRFLTDRLHLDRLKPAMSDHAFYSLYRTKRKTEINKVLPWPDLHSAWPS